MKTCILQHAASSFWIRSYHMPCFYQSTRDDRHETRTITSAMIRQNCFGVMSRTPRLAREYGPNWTSWLTSWKFWQKIQQDIMFPRSSMVSTDVHTDTTLLDSTKKSVTIDRNEYLFRGNALLAHNSHVMPWPLKNHLDATKSQSSSICVQESAETPPKPRLARTTPHPSGHTSSNHPPIPLNSSVP